MNTTAVNLKILKFENSPSFQVSWTWSDVFWRNKIFVQQLSTQAELGNSYEPSSSGVNMASYEEPFDQSESPIFLFTSEN